MKLNIRKVGVIGAGQMGNGIAHVCALAGFPVLLNDVSMDRIKSGLATVNGNMARQVSKKLISESDRQSALERITPAEGLDAMADCDLVIETAAERKTSSSRFFPRCARSSNPRRSSAPTRHRFRSRASPRPRIAPSASSAFIS